MLLFCFCVGFIPSVFAKESNSGLDAYAIIVPAGSDKKVLYLQKYKNGSWSTVKSWSFSGKGYTDVCKSYSTNSGKYRTKVSVNVEGENINLYSDEKIID